MVVILGASGDMDRRRFETFLARWFTKTLTLSWIPIVGWFHFSCNDHRMGKKTEAAEGQRKKKIGLLRHQENHVKQTNVQGVSHYRWEFFVNLCQRKPQQNCSLALVLMIQFFGKPKSMDPNWHNFQKLVWLFPPLFPGSSLPVRTYACWSSFHSMMHQSSWVSFEARRRGSSAGIASLFASLINSSNI